MSKKSFFDFDVNLTENYRLKNMFGGLNMGSQAVDDGNSDHFYLGWQKELRRLNAFVGAIARGRYIDPDSVIANLRTKLFVMGIVFDPVSVEDQDEGQFFLPLRQYEGIRKAEDGSLEQVNYLDEAFPNGIYLHLNWYVDETGMTKLGAKIITAEELDQMAQDDEELAAALSESLVVEEEDCDCDDDEEDDDDDDMEDDEEEDLTESMIGVYGQINNYPKKKISELPADLQADGKKFLKQMRDNQKSGDPEKTVVAVFTGSGDNAEVSVIKINSPKLKAFLSSKKGYVLTEDTFKSFKDLTEEKGDQEEYQRKLAAHLKKNGYDSVADIPKDKKDEFFNSLDRLHKSDEEELSEAVAFKSLGSDEYDIISKGKSVGTIRKLSGSFEADYMIGKQRMIHHTGSGSSLKTVDDLKKVVTKNLVKSLTEAAPVAPNPISFKVKSKLDKKGTVDKLSLKTNKVTMVGWDTPESLSSIVGVTPKTVEVLTKGSKKIERAIYADGSVLEVSVGEDTTMNNTLGLDTNSTWVSIKAMAPMKEEVGDKEEYQKKVRKALKDAGYENIKDIPDDEKDEFFDKLDSMHTSDDEEKGIAESTGLSLKDLLAEASQVENAVMADIKKIAKLTDANNKIEAAILGCKTLVKQASPQQASEIKRLMGRFERLQELEGGLNGEQAKQFNNFLELLWNRAKQVLPDNLAKAFKAAF